MAAAVAAPNPPSRQMPPNTMFGQFLAVADEAERKKPAKELGNYVLIKTLGQGEFGKVKLAVHKTTKQQVAVKLIGKESIQSNNRREKVWREISILQSLNHPNIVKLYEVVESEKYIGMVMEYASGGELFEHIMAHRCLKEKDAGKFFAQLLSGVSYLHSQGIVHRDLKLENLLLDADRNVIITDLGFANRFGADEMMQTACGSPCYAAPELVISKGYVGPMADVWSCGVILYAMLAGFLPYDDDPSNPEGENISLLYKYILTTPLKIPDHVSSDAKDILQRILVPNPQYRWSMEKIKTHRWLQPYAKIFQQDVRKAPPVATGPPLPSPAPMRTRSTSDNTSTLPSKSDKPPNTTNPLEKKPSAIYVGPKVNTSAPPIAIEERSRNPEPHAHPPQRQRQLSPSKSAETHGRYNHQSPIVETAGKRDPKPLPPLPSSQSKTKSTEGSSSSLNNPEHMPSPSSTPPVDDVAQQSPEVKEKRSPRAAQEYNFPTTTGNSQGETVDPFAPNPEEDETLDPLTPPPGEERGRSSSNVSASGPSMSIDSRSSTLTSQVSSGSSNTSKGSSSTVRGRAITVPESLLILQKRRRKENAPPVPSRLNTNINGTIVDRLTISTSSSASPPASPGNAAKRTGFLALFQKKGENPSDPALYPPPVQDTPAGGLLSPMEQRRIRSPETRAMLMNLRLDGGFSVSEHNLPSLGRSNSSGVALNQRPVSPRMSKGSELKPLKDSMLRAKKVIEWFKRSNSFTTRDRSNTFNASMDALGGSNSLTQLDDPFANPPSPSIEEDFTKMMSKIRVYRGPVNQEAISSKNPKILLDLIAEVLLSLECEFKLLADFKLKCYASDDPQSTWMSSWRSLPPPQTTSTKRAGSQSDGIGPPLSAKAIPGSSSGSLTHPSSVKNSLIALDNNQKSHSTTSLEETKNQSNSAALSLHGDARLAEAEANNGGSSINLGFALSSGVMEGDDAYGVRQSFSSGVAGRARRFKDMGAPSSNHGVIKFTIEICRIKNLSNLFILEFKRISGDRWASKRLYQLLISSLALNSKA